MVALVAVLVLVMGVAMVGIVAAIAIPSLLRARVSANEAATIGDLRTVVSAQAAYASANAGFPDRLECLAQPTQCIPNYPGTAPVFLDRLLLESPRHGYRFRFVPGTAAQPDGSAAGRISPSSLTGFAYVAEPVTAGQTGIRAFCAGASGLICFETSGAIREAGDGTCPETCAPIR
jgi:type II secretory pathway pseudopilin PulG